MYSYTAYGLQINSDLLIPEYIKSGSSNAEVVIRLAPVGDFPTEIPRQGNYFHLTPQKAYFFWSHIGKMVIQNGSEVLIEPFSEVEDALIRIPLVGMALATLLQQRGVFVFHASAVAIGQQAVIFVGDQGAGKSTMSAMLYARGHQMLSDDVVGLSLEPSICPVVIPSFPQFKLLPESVVAALGDDPNRLPPVAIGEKKRMHIASGFSNVPVPLKRIYVLAKDENILGIQRLQPQEALPYLIHHWYMAMFGKQRLQSLHDIQHLHQCATLIRTVPVCRLVRPHSLDLLQDVAKLVETDLAEVGPLVTV